MGHRDDEQDDAASPFAQALARAGGRPSKVIDFPGLDGVRVALWCPNEDEESEAEVEARKRLTGRYKMSALDLSLAQETELFERERDIELLTLVLRDPNDPDEAFFESSDEARKLSRPQRKALIAAKDDYLRERFMRRTPDEADEIVRLVRESKEAGVLSTWLASCESASELRALVEVLATALMDSTPSTTSSSSNA